MAAIIVPAGHLGGGFQVVGSGGGWTPASFGSDLVAWYKADTEVFADAGSTLATNGQKVQQWNDQSGNGYHLSQGSSGFRPTYLATGFNGLPTIQFVAANNTILQTQSAPVSLGGTTAGAFGVGQMLTGTASNGRLVSYVSPAGGNDFDNTTSAIFVLRDGTNNAIGAYRGGPYGTEPVSLVTNMRMGGVFDGSNVTMYVNNVAGTPVANSDTFGATGDIRISRASEPWDGPSSEIVVVKIGPSPTQLTQLDDYFKAKWGL